MNNRFTRWPLIAALGILPLSAQTPVAAPIPPKPMTRMAERLKLTDAQKVQIQAIRTRHEEGGQARKQAAMETRKAFRQAMQNPDTPESQIRSLHQAMEDKTLDLLLDHRAMQAEIRAALTPEQRIEWDKMQAYRMGLMQGRRGGPKGMGY